MKTSLVNTLWIRKGKEKMKKNEGILWFVNNQMNQVEMYNNTLRRAQDCTSPKRLIQGTSSGPGFSCLEQ